MPTCYFDRNIFDQIDKKRGITEDDIRTIREAVANGRIEILVSFETVQETAHAPQEIALRGLKLIRELSRAAFPIKPHTELVRDEIQRFAEGKEAQPPFLYGDFTVERVIEDIEDSSSEILDLLEDDRSNRDHLNAKLVQLVEDERRALGEQRPRTFDIYWNARSRFYGEGFAYYAGFLDQCREIGIERLLELRSVRVSIGALLSLLYAVMIEGRVVKDGTARDLQHAGLMSTADIVVTDDGELRRLLRRIPVDNFEVLTLNDLVNLLG